MCTKRISGPASVRAWQAYWSRAGVEGTPPAAPFVRSCRMFFIFGSPRSATTILAQCLSAHSQIVVPHDTDFLVPAAFVVRRIPDLDVGRRLVADLLTEARSYRHNIGEFLAPERAREAVLHAEYDLASMAEASLTPLRS